MRNLMLLAFCIFMLSSSSGCEDKSSAEQSQGQEPLQTCKVETMKVQSSVEATGVIQPGIEGGAKIYSPLGGTVEKIFVQFGQAVRKGAPLAAVKSSDVSDTYSSYLSAQSQLAQADRSYNLNKQLFDVGAVTRNDLLVSKAGYEQAKALSEGLKKKLDIYGSSSGNGVKGTLILKAPIDGHVVDIQGHIGDRFDTSNPIMTIANPDKVVVVANLYDTDIPRVQKGKDVIFHTDVFPDRPFKGVVSYVSDVEDTDSKTVKAFIQIHDGKELFKQNMFLKIKIMDGEKDLTVLPKTALIYKDGKFYADVKKGASFEQKEVKTIKDVSDRLMAVEGLSAGDEVAACAILQEKS